MMPDKSPKGVAPEIVDKIEFEPIKGYPMLYWKGKRPFTSTQYYPAQLKETYGPEVNGWRNRIYWGDNLQVMSHLLKEFRGKINLIYIDPPFDSKADYKKKIQLRGQAFTNDSNAFEEKQYGDIWTNDEYLQFMYERLVLIRELLSDNGSIYVHCDYRKSANIRLILDELFGSDNFRNEIIWKRTNAHNMASRGYVRSNDSILFYTKSSNFEFNTQYQSISEAQLSRYKLDSEGRYYTGQDLTFTGTNPSKQFEWRGTKPPANRQWGLSVEKLEELWHEGLILTKKDGTPRLDGFKVFLDDKQGSPITCLWDDIARVGNTSSARTEYPTQKPEELLDRIIKTSSNPGDIVFDCFMGSGTTQAVAMKLGRKFIGADINLGALQTTTKRLIDIEDNQKSQNKLIQEDDITRYFGFEVYNVNHYDLFQNPLQAKELLVEALEIQPLPPSLGWDGEKDGRLVKIMPVNRLATRADLNELIANFDYKSAEQRQNENPNKVVEKILLVCMGHEPDLAAQLKLALAPFKVDVEVVDILRDRSKLEFKRDSEAKIATTETELVIEKFYPMNLLQKLSLFKENVENWRELVESVMIDFNYDGAIFQPTLLDIPEKNEFVIGKYEVPAEAGNIRVKITDLLSESLEVDA